MWWGRNPISALPESFVVQRKGTLHFCKIPKFGKLLFFHRVRNPIHEVVLEVEGLAHLRLFLDSSNGVLPGFDRRSPQLSH